MKKISILLFISLNCFSQKPNWIPFNWVGDTVSGRYYDKLVITIPVSLDNLPHRFNMQFDLGATNTIIYGNSFRNYLTKYPDFQAKFDSTLKFRIQSQTNYKFKDVALKLGKVSFGQRNIGLFKNFGDEISIDSVTTNSEKHIGTIAPDLFQDKILIIDYPNKRLAVMDKLSEKYAKASFQPFSMEEGRINIPLEINGKTEDLMFDTGSSLFALLTTESNANDLSKAVVSDSLRISNWRDYFMVYGKKVETPVKLGTKTLEPTLVFYDKIKKFDPFFKEERIWGITGNAYFLNNVVIIDYKNKRFGIL